jgi:hypothetical protein
MQNEQVLNPNRSLDPVTNPYAALSQPSFSNATKSRWIRRFLILNAVLIVVPTLTLLAIYLWIELSIKSQTKPATNGPVLYEHSVSVDVDPWVPVACFAIPNMILAMAFAFSRFCSRRNEFFSNAES